MSLIIRQLELSDSEKISAAFTNMGWNKPAVKYEEHLQEQERGERIVLLAEVENDFAGYLQVVWEPKYAYFKDNGIPEIQDFNVLQTFRRRGIASRLLDEAEGLISKRRPVAGIGVGLHPGYNAAQRLYVLRGYVPDAQGVCWNNEYIKAGQNIVADDELVLYFVKTINRL